LAILILVLLTLAAFFIGRAVQWLADARHAMGPGNRRR
jgi:hypothetical protein